MQYHVATQLTYVSEWIANLRFNDLPAEVVEMAKLQILDAFSSICAGSRCQSGIKIRKMLNEIKTDGPCTIIPSGEKCSITESIYYHAALINSLELDNFSFFGHFGQSAVSVALAVSEMNDKSGEEMILGQVAALEVAGRLGAYLTSGPQQGHMRAYVHRVAGAIATSKTLNFTAETTAMAMAIALSMPEFPLFPASFSPETKVICTSSPAVEGYRAALLAEQGFNASLDIIEHPMGFWKFFSYKKNIPDIWKHVGKTWVAYSISFKNFATCAYAQGPVTAAVNIFNSKEYNSDNIRAIEVEVPMITMIMEKFSIPHFGADLTVVNTNFSTRRSIATALLYGELTGEFFKDGNFESKKNVISQLTDKIVLRHNWKLTIDLIRGIDDGLTGAGKPGVLGMNGAGNTLKEFKKLFGSQPLLSWGDIPKLFSLKSSDRNYFFKRYWQGHRELLPFSSKTARMNHISHEKDLHKMSFKLSGIVTVTLKNGTEIKRQCTIPPGFAGDSNRKEVVRKKYLRESEPVLGIATINILDQLANLEQVHLRNFLSVLRK